MGNPQNIQLESSLGAVKKLTSEGFLGPFPLGGPIGNPQNVQLESSLGAVLKLTSEAMGDPPNVQLESSLDAVEKLSREGLGGLTRWTDQWEIPHKSNLSHLWSLKGIDQRRLSGPFSSGGQETI